MALACEPRLLIADEPTTALDVTIQAQILELLRDLVEDTGTALIMITHDLGVVAGLCDEINVLYGGRLVERAERHALFAEPRHPYTGGLLGSVPRLDGDRGAASTPIPGSVADNLPWTSGAPSPPGAPMRSTAAWWSPRPRGHRRPPGAALLQPAGRHPFARRGARPRRSDEHRRHDEDRRSRHEDGDVLVDVRRPQGPLPHQEGSDLRPRRSGTSRPSTAST